MTFLFAGLSAGITACDGSFGPPPLRVEFRDSLVDLGQIVQLTNTSTEKVTGIEIKITNPDDDVKHYTIESLAPGEMIEVGWKKLEGFRVQRGCRISLRSDGHLMPRIVKQAAEDRSGALVEDD